MPSVSFLAFTLSSLAYHPVSLVPSFMSSQMASSNVPEKCTMNMDPLLVFASNVSKLQRTCRIDYAVEVQFIGR